MALLTNQEKETLKDYADFREECKWAILNQASYWKGLDGTTIPGGQTAANLARWAKSRAYSAQINLNPSIAEGTGVVDRFLVYIKTIDCVTGAFDPATVVAELLNENHFEAMANQWFDDQIASSAF